MDQGALIEQADAVVAGLRADFLAYARDLLDEFDGLVAALESGQAPAADALAALRREAHNLKGTGGSFGFPLVSAIAHRLEDYLAAIERPSAREIRDLETFVERIREIVGRGEEPDETTAAELVRTLPAKGGVEDGASAPAFELLLVMPRSTLRRFVETHLVQEGYRVVSAERSFDGFELAVRTRPDAVIATAVIDALGGADLARALAAVAPARAMPVVLLTSLDAGTPELSALPATIRVIRKEPGFEEALKGALGEVLEGTGPAPART